MQPYFESIFFSIFETICPTKVIKKVTNNYVYSHANVMDRLQTSGELQDKTSFIDPSTGVDLLKSYSPDYLLL
jgi:hypothetical protein